MHSKIFQITQTRVEKDNYLNEDTLMQGDNSHFDYCAEIDDEERKEYIGYLVNHVLPKGMFELTSEDTILYKGGTEKWKEEFVSEIRKRAEAITPDKMQDWIGPVYQLEKFLKDPLDTGYWFYTDAEGVQSYAEQSYEFLRESSLLNRVRHFTSEGSSTITSDTAGQASGSRPPHKRAAESGKNICKVSNKTISA